MTKSYSTRIPLYGTRLRLNVSTDEDILGGNEAQVEALTDPSYVLVVSLRPRASPGTVAHESLHITRRALERAGVRFNASTEETYAYTLDWVVDWITNKLYPNARRKTT